MSAARRYGTTPTKPSESQDRLGITDVAYAIGRRYQQTRDLMLIGKFGECEYVAGRLTISRQQLTDWKAKQATLNAPKQLGKP